jgi:hypothetical protein
MRARRLENSELDLLKSMGFGLEEFKALRSVIVDFASEKGQPAEEGIAVRDFMSDIESHHFDYIRLRKTVDQLKTQASYFNTAISTQSQLAQAAMALLRKKGITQNDVIIEIMESYTPEDDLSITGHASSVSHVQVTHQSDVEKDQSTKRQKPDFAKALQVCEAIIVLQVCKNRAYESRIK